MLHLSPNKDGTPSETDLSLLKKKLEVELSMGPVYTALKAYFALWTKLVETEWEGPSSPATITRGCMIGWLYTSVSLSRWNDCIATNPFLKHFLRCFDNVNGFAKVPREVEQDFVKRNSDGKIWKCGLESFILRESNWAFKEGKYLIGEDQEREKKRRMKEGLGEFAVLMNLGRWCLWD